MKDEIGIAFEHHLICDVVISTLIIHQRMYAHRVDDVHTLIVDFTTAASIYSQFISDSLTRGINHGPHLLSFGIVNFRVICCIADLLKDGCFARVCSSYDQNSKAPDSFSKVLGISGCHREI
jgi:hypothetical protein